MKKEASSDKADKARTKSTEKTSEKTESKIDIPADEENISTTDVIIDQYHEEKEKVKKKR